ncbi:hypothetical protein V8D89_016228 [Ganoderma adspersum]
MPKLSLTFSEVFDYKAYAEDGTSPGLAQAEKAATMESSDPTAPPTDMAPAHFPSTFIDILNLPVQLQTPMLDPIRRPPVSRSSAMLSEPDIVPSLPPFRRADSRCFVDLSSAVAGPSRTPFDRLLFEHECMTSDFGSEFGGSDAVFYGGSESRRSSMCCDSDVEEGPLDWDDEEMACDEDTAMSDCGYDSVSESDASGSQSEDEELVSDGEAEVEEDGHDGTVSCGEATEATPLDIPPPAFPGDHLPSLRRSTRARKPPALFAPTSAPAPKKGKGKAVARKALSPAPPKRTSTKRARSPSPSPSSSDLTDDPDAPSGSASPVRKRARRTKRSGSATQALLIIPEGAPTEVPCAVGRCGEQCSLHNLDGLVDHFGKHYTKKQRKGGVLVRCRWGAGCTVRNKFSQVVRHLKKDHFGLSWECPDCRRPLSRADAVTRHQDRACPARRKNGSSKKGKGRRK